MTTALRETREETGLTSSDFKIIEHTKKELNYPVKGRPKRVIYWLAQLINCNAEVRLSDEHTEYKWLPLKEACALAKYEDAIDLLNYYEAFIISNNL